MNLWKNTIVTATLFGGSLLWAPHAHAAPTQLFTDSFTEPLGSRWSVVWNRQWADEALPCKLGPANAVWQLVQQAAKIEISGPPCIIDLAPTSLDLKNARKYSVSFTLIMHESVNMDRALSFAWQDSANWYDLKLLGNTVELQKVIRGQVHTLPGSKTQVQFQPNQPIPFTIDVIPQQSITVRVGANTILSVADQAPFLDQHTKKTIALRGSVGAISRSISSYDDVKVIAEMTQSSPSPTLSVDLLKQTDQRWAMLEYDHSRQWSDVPYMQRWGCAVTSMVMVMRYHGISLLPTGQSLTPGSLNQWLREQADGYIGGNLNWLAVTRLTKHIGNKYGTPKLEFSRVDASPSHLIALAKQDIQEKKPVILAVPGHFFVAHGIDDASQSLTIRDPAFSYEKLHQHPTQPISIRRFQPSFTDLSYLMFIVPKTLQVEVRNEAGDVVPSQRTSEFIQDPFSTSPATSPEVDQVFIAKPTDGTYTLKIAQETPGAYEVQVLAYDLDGSATMSSLSGSTHADGATHTIMYTKQPAVSPSPTPTTQPSPPSTPLPSESPTQSTAQTLWRSLLRKVQTLSSGRHFKHRFVARYFEALTAHAASAPTQHQRLYLTVIRQAVQIYEPFMTKTAVNQLMQVIKKLHTYYKLGESASLAPTTSPTTSANESPAK